MSDSIANTLNFEMENYTNYYIIFLVCIYIDYMYNLIMESKNDKFKRLANKRVPAAIDKLELVKNLANTNNYDYTKKETDEIIKVLNKSINEIKQAFNNKQESKFRI